MIIEICAVIVALSVVIVCAFIVKTIRKPDFFLEILENFVEDMAENEDLRKQVYILGGLFGNGIGQNLNLGKKVNAKDMFMGILGNWMQNAFRPGGQSTNAQSSQQTGQNTPSDVIGKEFFG